MRRAAVCLGVALCCALVGVPRAAKASEIDLGVSLGGMAVGSVPRFAISPHGGVSWRIGDSLRVGIHEMLSILPATNGHGVGVYDQLSATVGYAWDVGHIALGPSLAFFTLPVCGTAQCARMNGVAPGGEAQASVYFAGPLGVSASARVDWISGIDGVLPAGVAGVLVAGPVIRWNMR